MKGKKGSYDVIIAGAGPAGLLLGRELSKKHSVLILEAKRAGQTNKNWMTYQDRWEKAGLPASLIQNRFGHWHMQMQYPGRSSEYIIEDSFICFDEHDFLVHLAREFRKNKGVLLERTPFETLRREGDGVIINEAYRARLFIDCSGIHSPLLKRLCPTDPPIFINCYAYIAKFSKGNGTNFYCIFKNKADEPYSVFGYTQVSSHHAQLQFLRYSRTPEDPDQYAKDFKAALKRFSIPPHRIVEYKKGSYPSGVIKKVCLDNIFFFGDAGFYSPGYNGMGFNEILRHHRRVSHHLSSCLHRGRLTASDLCLPADRSIQINDLFFQLVGLTLGNLSPEIIDGILKAMSESPAHTRQAIMRNTLSGAEIVSLVFLTLSKINKAQLLSAIAHSDLKHVVRASSQLLRHVIDEEAGARVFRLPKSKAKDMY